MYMKKDIHPGTHPVIFRDTGAGVDFFGLSTKTSDQKETVDGVSYAVIPVEVSSASHPFYTGQDTVIDSAGRVEKFKARVGKKMSHGKKQRTRTPDQSADAGTFKKDPSDTGVSSEKSGAVSSDGTR